MWKHSKYLSTYKWLNKMGYVHPTKYYPAVKKNEVTTHTAIWTTLARHFSEELRWKRADLTWLSACDMFRGGSCRGTEINVCLRAVVTKSCKVTMRGMELCFVLFCFWGQKWSKVKLFDDALLNSVKDYMKKNIDLYIWNGELHGI